MKVAFLGLGVMGFPMARHLHNAGHETSVYNRTTSKAQSWAGETGGRWSADPVQACVGAEAVFVCVGDDADVRLLVNQILMSEHLPSVIVDHTTTSAELARELNQACLNRGVAWIDAPVSGGQAGVENGVLTIMCGGDAGAYDRVAPVMDAYARQHRLMGPAGQGQLTKMVNQICIAGLVQGLAEGLNFAAAAGLDQQAVIDVISKGAAGSWQMENRHKTMIEGQYEHGFAVEWMRKDLGHCLREARNNGAALPVAALVDQFYGEVENMGGRRFDTSSLLARLDKLRS